MTAKRKQTEIVATNYIFNLKNSIFQVDPLFMWPHSSAATSSTLPCIRGYNQAPLPVNAAKDAWAFQIFSLFDLWSRKKFQLTFWSELLRSSFIYQKWPPLFFNPADRCGHEDKISYFGVTALYTQKIDDFEDNLKIENKLGLSCAKLSTAWAGCLLAS